MDGTVSFGIETSEMMGVPDHLALKELETLVDCFLDWK